MALSIKNPEVERLVAEIARLTGESKTEAIRLALVERRRRLAFQVARRDRRQSLLRVLEEEVWPQVPDGELGRPMDKAEREEILGLGPAGV